MLKLCLNIPNYFETNFKNNEKNLREIQLEYLELIEQQWGAMYKNVINQKHEFYKFSCAYTNKIFNDNQQDKWINSILSFFECINEFWDTNWQQCNNHIKNYNKIKATFGGSLFPSSNENIISTAGLYLDTIIFPCPIMKNKPLWQGKDKKELIQIFIKNILDLLSFSNMIKEDLETPIIIVFPSEDNMRELSSKGSDLFLKTGGFIHKHFNDIFNEEFNSVQEVAIFMNSFNSIESIEKAIKSPNRLFFEYDNAISLNHNLHNFVNDFPIKNLSIGEAIFRRTWSQIAQGFYVNESALQINSTPLITSDNSWKQFKWGLEYQSLHKPHEQELLSSHIPKALFSERYNNLDWLGNIPTETILEIRKNKHEEEIRAILSNGVKNLVNLNSENYFRTSDQVVLNLENAFNKHSKKLQDILNAKLKFYGLTVPLAVSTLGVGIACSVMPGLGTLGKALGVGLTLAGTTEKIPGFPTVKKNFKEIQNLKEYNTTATGLLFKHLK